MSKVGHLRNAFTLIELLTVVAIIALLVSILLPSLAGARDAAKKTRSLGSVKAIGVGLELFRNENPRECAGESYPSSEGEDDPTDSSWKPFPDLYGAHWAVRYLLGKNLDGYIAPTSVAKRHWYTAQPHWTQRGWYDQPGTPESPLEADAAPFARAVYIDMQLAPIRPLRDVPGAESAFLYDPNAVEYRSPVFVDAWGNPILYYAANARNGSSDTVNICRDSDRFPAAYNFGDNAIFTEGCTKGGCVHRKWDFGGGTAHYEHPVEWRALSPPWPAPDWSEVVPATPNSFAHYIMDKAAYEASNGKTVVPVRRDSYLLISPGRDLIIGSADDVRNF